MPKAWRALPHPDKPDVLIKAPDYKTFTFQEDDGDRFRLRRQDAAEAAQAEAMLKLLANDNPHIPPGEKFEIWRYPQGLAAKLPSGWTVMIPFGPEGRPKPGGPMPGAASEQAASKPRRRKAGKDIKIDLTKG